MNKKEDALFFKLFTNITNRYYVNWLKEKLHTSDLRIFLDYYNWFKLLNKLRHLYFDTDILHNFHINFSHNSYIVSFAFKNLLQVPQIPITMMSRYTCVLTVTSVASAKWGSKVTCWPSTQIARTMFSALCVRRSSRTWHDWSATWCRRTALRPRGSSACSWWWTRETGCHSPAPSIIQPIRMLSSQQLTFHLTNQGK